MKLNKKGFTLAELLIVVAVMAILVAIAVPTFSSATKKAEIATDDANIRNAYSVYSVAKLTGMVDFVDEDGATVTELVADTYYFTTDGKFATDTDLDTVYTMKQNHESCTAAPGVSSHETGDYVGFIYESEASSTFLIISAD